MIGISTQQNQNSRETEKGIIVFHSSLALHHFIDVQYTLTLVHLRRFAVSAGAGEVVHSVLVQAGAAHNVGLEAEDADSGWSGELHLMAVAQLQEQLPAFTLCPCFEANSNEL